jgi:hypothetical protein
MNLKNFYRRFFSCVCLFLVVTTGWPGSTEPAALADEGMWLFNDLPKGYLKERYGFEPGDQWAEHLMKSSVRFNVGGSASFVSSDGLVLTNHHVGADTLYKLSTPERNVYDDGYLARSREEELKAPDLELNQLINIQDVTAEVNAAVNDQMSPAEANLARRAAIEVIEKRGSEQSGLRSNVITLYGGGRYHLYQFKRYTDVRLVWSPEASIAFFGGDADNFEYPRYCLDACLFRVYENGKPAKIEHFLKWSDGGPQSGELTFVSGNPGRTSRIFTVDALKNQRDSRLPYTMDFIRRREVLLQQFSLRGPEQARQAKDGLMGFQNSRKARGGMLQGLQDPAVMAAKAEQEQQLLNQIRDNPQLAPLASAWDQIQTINGERKSLLGKGINLNSTLFNFALTLVQLAEENQKPSSQRLREFQDAGRESLELQLFSEAPVYRELEKLILGDLIGLMLEKKGGDDEICQTILAGKSPQARAAELIDGSRLHEPAYRRELAGQGSDGIAQSTDPLIRLAAMLDEQIRVERKVNEELDEQERQAYAKISEAKFSIQGTSVYPDATFSLRLSFGPVQGYEQNGTSIPAMTLIGGAFEHELANQGKTDFSLPASWHQARSEGRLDGSIPFNFVNTADIIGGNSGSPVVNRNLELVGLIFDGNIQSLTSDYLYDDRQGRAVSVHSEAIRHAIRHVYQAPKLADSLGR